MSERVLMHAAMLTFLILVVLLLERLLRRASPRPASQYWDWEGCQGGAPLH